MIYFSGATLEWLLSAFILSGFFEIKSLTSINWIDYILV